MKSIIFLYILLFFVLAGNAQQQRVSVQVKAGINHSGLKGADTDSLSNGGAVDSRPGFSVGLSVENRMTTHFALKHELLFAARNIQLHLDDGIHPSISSNLKEQYLELLPVAAAWNYKGLQLYAGPYLGILLSASIQRIDADGRKYTDRQLFGTSQANGNYAQKFDAGMAAGVEYCFPMGLSIGGRFMRGFVPLVETSSMKDQLKIYHEVFLVTLGFRLTRSQQ